MSDALDQARMYLSSAVANWNQARYENQVWKVGEAMRFLKMARRFAEKAEQAVWNCDKKARRKRIMAILRQLKEQKRKELEGENGS